MTPVRQGLHRLRGTGQEVEDADSVVRGNGLTVRQAPRGSTGLTAAHLSLTHSQSSRQVSLRFTRRMQERRHRGPHPLIETDPHTGKDNTF